MILLLSMFCLLSFSNCSRPKSSIVLIGETRIAGKIEAGKISWEAKEDQLAKYYLVTPAFVKLTFSLAIDNAELKAQIAKLIAAGHEK